MAAAFVPSGHVVLDIETAVDPAVAGGWEKTGSMGVSVAVVYDVARDRYRVFDSSELEDLHDCLDRCDRIVTWAGWNFDFPVIYGRDRPEWPTCPEADRKGGRSGRPLRERSRDMLLDVYACLGLGPNDSPPGGWKLDDVHENLFGYGKCGSGAAAPELYRQGRWGQLFTYCMHDVFMTANVERFVKKHGFLFNKLGQFVRFGRPAEAKA